MKRLTTSPNTTAALATNSMRDSVTEARVPSDTVSRTATVRMCRVAEMIPMTRKS